MNGPILAGIIVLPDCACQCQWAGIAENRRLEEVVYYPTCWLQDAPANTMVVMVLLAARGSERPTRGSGFV